MERKGGGFGLLAAHTSVFIASFCVMVVELVAGRLVSRHLGSSLYTWTAVIGIILAGLAVGNYLGGRIADRFRAAPALCLLFLTASGASVAVIVMNHWIGSWTILWGLPWPARVALHVTLVFWAPAAAMGTIGPVVARMALDLGRSTGRTLGSVYAWGVVGSIAGTFATGYLFIGLMGVESILWAVALLLCATGFAYAPRSRAAWGWSAALAALLVLGHAGPGVAADWGQRLALRAAGDPTVLWAEDGRYGRVEVRRLPVEGDVRGLYIDKLLHAQVSMDEPDALLYDYTRVFAALAESSAARRTPQRTLTIGGGGFVFPRYLQRRWPDAIHDVVEIDPAVTRAAHAAFGLAPESPLRIHHEDGRAFVRQAPRHDRGPYDLVFVDAVNDFAVPYQLTTREFFAEVHALLASDGMLLVNTIDALDSGLLVGALAATVREVFEDVSVWAPVEAGRPAVASRSTLVVVTNAAGLDAESDHRRIARMSDDALERTIRRTGSLVLSDDHAPVEHLVAPVVRAAAREMGANEALRRALAASAAGDADGYLESCRLAVSLDPSLAEAHYNLGLAWYSRKERGMAADHWRRALALHPGYFEARFNLATALLRQGDAEGARRHFATARDLRPHSAPAARGLGIALEALGDAAAALAHYREALELSPQDGDSAAAVRRLEGAAGAIDPPSQGT